MSERKYTAEEIVKALECCQHRECQECIRLYTGRPIEDDCRLDLIYDSLTLIKRQKSDVDKLQEVNADLNESLRLAAEANKDLKVELDAMRGAANSYKMRYEEAKAEIEEWKANANDWQNQYLKLIEEMEIYQEHIDQDIIYAKAIKTEAIKEFAERLKKRERSNAVCCWCVHSDVYGRRAKECDEPYVDKNGKEYRACYGYAKFESYIDNLVAEMTEGEKI